MIPKCKSFISWNPAKIIPKVENFINMIPKVKNQSRDIHWDDSEG
jgi:hypothetical protein